MSRAAFDHRVFVRFAHDTPDHPKVIGLSDKAFRVWFGLICWSSRQERDGVVPPSVMRAWATPKVIRELVDGRLLHEHPDGYELHDYLDFNRSRDEIAAFRTAKGEAGTLGNHRRWHVARRRVDPDCEHCTAEGGAPA